MNGPSAIVLVNRSSQVTSEQLSAIACALEEQVHGSFFSAYGGAKPTFSTSTSMPTASSSLWPVEITDAAPPDAGELGVHEEDGATPTGHIYVTPILEHGGSVSSGPNSVSVCASHEVLEMLADATANLWAMDPTGAIFALEVADPVEGYAYQACNGVFVSDFVYPGWFDAGTAVGAQVDFMGKLVSPGPFVVDPSGYAIVGAVSSVTERFGRGATVHALPAASQARWIVFGAEVPEWKRRHKLSTHRRLRRGCGGKR